MPPVLELRDVSVTYSRHGTSFQVLREVNLQIEAGGAFGLVGESGCGKSTLALATMRYLPRNGRLSAGSVLFRGDDVATFTSDRLRHVRGAEMAMVYQDPGSALNPGMRVRSQLAEVYRFHSSDGGRHSATKSRDMLKLVALADPERILESYPHQLSGGQQQRVMIAMALAARPKLLILDEPTTGLDATVEAEVMDLLVKLRSELGLTILFISHNLALVKRLCDEVGVLYAGRMVEYGRVADVFLEPRHPYTAGLLRCVPTMAADKRSRRLQPMAGTLPALGYNSPGCLFAPRCGMVQEICRSVEPELRSIAPRHEARCHFAEDVTLAAADPGQGDQPVAAAATPRDLLRLDGLRKLFGRAVACDDISLDVHEGEILGLVGESGSGKTTLVRCLAGLVHPDAGALRIHGSKVSWRIRGRGQATLRELQMVFQNPDSTLNPRHTVRYTIGRAIRKLRGTRSIAEVIREVRLEPQYLAMRPPELSGGLRQRVAIARAFAGNPKLVLCDEPVSALDVSVQATILNLLADLAERDRVAYVFISHDLAVVHYLADRIAVMYLGQLVEIGPSSRVVAAPQHPYTEALFSATPTLADGVARRIRLSGPMPSAAAIPSGCRFHTRCPRKVGVICEEHEPPWLDAGGGHTIRCHIPATELRKLQSVRSTQEAAPGEPQSAGGARA